MDNRIAQILSSSRLCESDLEQKRTSKIRERERERERRNKFPFEQRERERERERERAVPLLPTKVLV